MHVISNSYSFDLIVEVIEGVAQREIGRAIVLKIIWSFLALVNLGGLDAKGRSLF